MEEIYAKKGTLILDFSGEKLKLNTINKPEE